MIQLKTLHARGNQSPLIERIKQLYLDSFPPAELLSWSDLLVMLDQDHVDLIGIFDGLDFVGFLTAMRSSHHFYINYLVIDPSKRSKGYGSRVFKALGHSFPDYSIVLEVEPQDKAAANAQQRQRRLAFYLANDFQVSKYQSIMNGYPLDILYRGKQVYVDELEQLLNQQSDQLDFIPVQQNKD